MARLLEFGLGLILVLAPLPFGSVGPAGRFALELAALTLLGLWGLRALTGLSTPLPPRTVQAGILGFLILAALQAIPSGAVAEFVSPASDGIRVASNPTGEALQAELRMLEPGSGSVESKPTLSVDPGATASALRTGSALAALLLVATSVTALRGVRRIGLALLISAGFQGLYGLYVLFSVHPRIWNVDKIHYVDSATGTLINRNHYACLLAMSLACGTGLILDQIRLQRHRPGNPLLAILRDAHGRILVLPILLVLGLTGLLTSFSRAGIAVGLLAMLTTVILGGRIRGSRTRIAAALLILFASAVPLAQFGGERLIDRYLVSSQDLVQEGGRARVWLDTLSLAASFPVAGTGFGTFAEAYPLYRSPEVRKFYAHAHNDALQLLAEAGLLGVLLACLVLFPLLWRQFGILLRGDDPLYVGFAAALLAFLMHSLVDFNLHIPSNAAVAATLAGVVLGRSCRTTPG